MERNRVVLRFCFHTVFYQLQVGYCQHKRPCIDMDEGKYMKEKVNVTGVVAAMVRICLQEGKKQKSKMPTFSMRLQ